MNRREALGLVLGGAVGVTAGCAGQELAGRASGVRAPGFDDPQTPGEQEGAKEQQGPGADGDADADPDATPSEPPGPPSREEIEVAYSDVEPGAFGLQVPGTKLSLPDGCSGAALTLDACGGPGGSAVDEELLQTLRDLQIPATLFINQRWAQENSRVMQEVVDDRLFEIQNHGSKHLPLSVTGQSAYGIAGTGSAGEVYDEIMGNQDFLYREYGLRCTRFRSGTAHLDEASASICRDLGLTPVNFTVNLDDGATLPADGVAARMQAVTDGDIILGHVNDPTSGTGPGLASALPVMAGSGLRFVTLDEAC